MQLKISKTTIFLTIFFLLSLPVLISAQSNEIFTLMADGLKNDKTVALDKLQWKYHAGDNEDWANPNLEDASWETLKGSALTLDNLPKNGWSGIGWFRLRLKVDESLANKQLTLILNHWGASEIYIDGELLNRFGKVGATPEAEEAFSPNGTPILFSFKGERSEHLIAVRHSVTALRDPSSFWSKWTTKRVGLLGRNNAAGLEMNIIKSENSILDREAFLKFEAGNRFGRAGLVLMIGLLFLLLFFFYPSQRAHLYFSIFALFIVGNNVSNFLRSTSHYDLTLIAVNDVFFYFTWAGFNISLLVFLYTDFAKRIPKYFWVFVAAYAVQLLLNIVFSDSVVESWLLNLLLLFVLFEQTRITINALVKRKSGALIVGAGVWTFAFLTLFNLLIRINTFFDINIPLPELMQLLVRQVSTLGVTVPISIYLARSFAQTNKNLEAQLIKEVEHERNKARLLIVEAENERKTKELEEARALQLSMLPKKLPEIPNLEIAAYMKPATEVGGDYYDFHVGNDGTLTVAVGDATGHGLKAGTVVTAAKTLFRNYADEADIPHIFKKSSRVLKEMNLRGLFMAMTMLKIKDNRLAICAAGMPSMLIFRHATGQIEEVAFRAMPLGSPFTALYEQHEFDLSNGDAIVLMSDGFPEMFNEAGEMLADDAAKKVLRETADKSPQEIIDRMVKVAEQWAENRPPDDDVTFVVMKIK